MNSAHEKIAIEHFRRRLAAIAFGAWVASVTETKSVEETARKVAEHHFSSTCLSDLVSTLRRNVLRRRKYVYADLLGCTMRDLLLKSKGITNLRRWARLQQCGSTRHVENDSCTVRKMERLFERWRRWTVMTRRIGNAFRRAVSGDIASQSTICAHDALTALKCNRSRSLRVCRNTKIAVLAWKRSSKKRVLGLLRLLVQQRSMQQIIYEDASFSKQRKRALRALLTMRDVVEMRHVGRALSERSCQFSDDMRRHRALARLWSAVVQKSKRVRAWAVLDRRSRVASCVRVLRCLLRLVAHRLRTLPVRAKVKLFLLNCWSVRRKSAALAEWQCHIGRIGIEKRRRKIADFQHRDRLLRLNFPLFAASTLNLGKQRHASFEAQCMYRRRRLLQGVQALRCGTDMANSVRAGNYKAVLFWKYWRVVRAVSRFKEFVKQRRTKRAMWQEARVAYSLSEKRAACAEFFQVALATAAMYPTRASRGWTVRQQHLAKKVATKWKSLVRQRRMERESLAEDVRTPVRSIDVYSVRAAPQGGALQCTSASSTLPLPAALPVARDLHVLSRAKPRVATASFVPLPASHIESALAARSDPSITTSQPKYAYLAVATDRIRPPFLRKQGEEDVDRGLPSQGSSGAGDSKQSLKYEEPHESEKDQQQATLPPMSDALLGAAGRLLEGGGVSPGTLLALQEFLQIRSELSRR